MKSFGYIDGANLDRGSKALDSKIDYKKMYGWLRQKYKLDKIYLFIGLIPKYTKLYEYLQECGYILIFQSLGAKPSPLGDPFRATMIY